MLASRPRVVKNGVQLFLMSEGTWIDTGLAVIAGAKCSYEIWIASAKQIRIALGRSTAERSTISKKTAVKC
jgi:hypothetical protein